MSDKLEKMFFKTFGIEPELIDSCNKPRHKCLKRFQYGCEKCACALRKNPQITDRILLELICITTDEEPNIEWLKNSILQEIIHRYKTDNFYNTDKVKHQVQVLFKEG